MAQHEPAVTPHEPTVANHDSAVPQLHVIVGGSSPADTLALVDATLAGGAPCVQLRSKSLSDRDLHALAVAVVERCQRVGAACIVNDRADVALASGADGVHLGADDLPVEAVRELAGASLLVGGTARDPDSARALAAAGADYLGVGPVYGTQTKDGLPTPFGPDGLAPVAASVAIPVVAIAGITVDRVAEVVAAGAHGIAVAGAVTSADDPTQATRVLVAALSHPPAPPLTSESQATTQAPTRRRR